MIFCRECGGQNLPNTLFCEHCGDALSEAATAARATGVRLKVRCYVIGSREALDLPDDAVIVLGRGSRTTEEETRIDLARFGAPAAGVSRRHARLLRRPEGLYLEDLNSLNGTYVNNLRLAPHQPVPLPWGAAVRLGGLELRFELSGEP